MTNREGIVLIAFILGAVLCFIGFFYFMRTDRKRVQKLKKKIYKKIYFDYSYDDFRQMLVKVHMRAVANKDNKKVKKTRDTLVQLDEVYDFLSSELNLKNWREY